MEGYSACFKLNDEWKGAHWNLSVFDYDFDLNLTNLSCLSMADFCLISFLCSLSFPLCFLSTSRMQIITSIIMRLPLIFTSSLSKLLYFQEEVLLFQATLSLWSDGSSIHSIERIEKCEDSILHKQRLFNLERLNHSHTFKTHLLQW